jgi:hypothetical protein
VELTPSPARPELGRISEERRSAPGYPRSFGDHLRLAHGFLDSDLVGSTAWHYRNRNRTKGPDHGTIVEPGCLFVDLFSSVAHFHAPPNSVDLGT